MSRVHRRGRIRGHARPPFLLLALVALAGVLGSCGNGLDPNGAEATAQPRGDQPPPSTAPTSQSTPDQAAPSDPASSEEPSAAVYLFFAGYPTQVGPFLVPVHRPVAEQGDVLAALRLLTAGPSSAETELHLSSAIPSGTAVIGVGVADGVATIDLNAAFERGGGSLSMLGRVAQFVFTATRFEDVDAVDFTIDGEALTVLGGEGILLEKPQRRADYASLLPPIAVESPTWGEPTGATVQLEGSTAVPRDAVHWALVDEGGHLAAEGVVDVSSGDPARPWGVELPELTWSPRSLIVFDLDSEGQQVAVLEYPLMPAD